MFVSSSNYIRIIRCRSCSDMLRVRVIPAMYAYMDRYLPYFIARRPGRAEPSPRAVDIEVDDDTCRSRSLLSRVPANRNYTLLKTVRGLIVYFFFRSYMGEG